MTQSSEESTDTGARPWPAPSPDATWWRSETAEGPSAPAPTPRQPAAPEVDPVTTRPDRAAPPDSTTPPDQPALAAPPDLEPPVADPAAAMAAEPTAPLPIVTSTITAEPQPDTDNTGATRPGGLRPDRPSRVRPGPSTRRRRPARHRKETRRPWLALPALVLISLVTAFFAWVSAEPFWLAVGHSVPGTATVASVAGSGIGERCVARFVADGHAFTVAGVDLTGLPGRECTVGTTVAARMVSPHGRQAYSGDQYGLHLRWGIGLALVLLCGLMIAWVSGAVRFAGWQRLAAIGLSLAGPLLVLAGMLAVAF